MAYHGTNPDTDKGKEKVRTMQMNRCRDTNRTWSEKGVLLVRKMRQDQRDSDDKRYFLKFEDDS